MRSFDPDGARADLSEAIAQFRATGSYTSLAGRLDSLGVLELDNGDLEAAQVYLHEAVAIADSLALPRFRWGVHTNLGYLAIMRAVLRCGAGGIRSRFKIRRTVEALTRYPRPSSSPWIRL